MAVLKSLSFAEMPKAGQNPILFRRTRTIARLEEQKRLLADPQYVRVSQRWTHKDGQKVQVEKQHKVSPWWRLDQSGGYVFFIRAGNKVLEFENGKTAVAVGAIDRLANVIDTLIAAVRTGELDKQLDQSSKQKVGKAKSKP